MWITFNQRYKIDKIQLVENHSGAYIKTGAIEYYDGSEWRTLLDIDKSSAGYYAEFSPVMAEKVRLKVMSTEAPASWYNKVALIHTFAVNSSAVSGIDEYLNVGTITNFLLYQNYPNPFNPTTTICYNLQKACNVNIEILDANGRFIKTLEKGWKPTGTYTVNFDSSDLASGVYFYRIQAGEFQQLRKMMLVK